MILSDFTDVFVQCFLLTFRRHVDELLIGGFPFEVGKGGFCSGLSEMWSTSESSGLQVVLAEDPDGSWSELEESV